MRWRMRDDKEVNLITRVIPHLVRSSRGNPNPLTGVQHYFTATDFHDSFAREYVEELLCVMVEVANLRRARRHEFLNHAQLRILYQVPAIAARAPDVVLGRQFADSFCVTLDSCQFLSSPRFDVFPRKSMHWLAK